MNCTPNTAHGLSAWLLLDTFEGLPWDSLNAVLMGADDGECGPLEDAFEALSAGNTGRAVELLREAVRRAGEPVPVIEKGRNRAARQRCAQKQRERLLNIARIALLLLEPSATQGGAA